jgi:Uma2 family endonuclease
VSAPAPKLGPTLADLLAQPEDERFELVAGELVRKEAGSGRHGLAQLRTYGALGPFDRSSGGPPERPGGWWIASEVLVALREGDVRRPDVAGWRRERLVELPAEPPVRVVPDWICEVLSPSNRRSDTIDKMRLYHAVEVRHYWLVDPVEEVLTVYRWTPEGYLHVLGATRGERVRAEPFEVMEIEVGVLFGDDPT